MASDIGVKFGVSGETGFKNAIKAVDSELKAMNTELGNAVTALGKDAKSKEALAQKTSALNRIIELNKAKLETLTEQHDKAKAKQDELAKAAEEAAQKYGENSKEAQKANDAYNQQRTVVNNLKNQMAQTTAAIDKAGSQMEESGNQSDGLSGKLTKLADIALVKLAQESLGKLDSVLNAITQKIAQAGQALWDMAKDSGEWADGLITTSVQTGISTEKLQEWTYAARFVDTEVDTIAKSMQKLTKNMTSSSKDTQGAFHTLGVSVQDSAGNLRSSETVFWEAIDALGRVQDETTRNSLAMQIFGKSAQELNPLIVAGAETWNQYCQEAHEAGAVLADEGVSALGAFDDAMQKNDATMEGIKRQIMSSLIPAFTVIAEKINAVAKKFSEWAKSKAGKAALSKLADMVGNVAQGLAENLAPAVETAIGVLNRIGEAVAWLAQHWETIKTVILTVVAAFAVLKTAMLALNIVAAFSNPITGVIALIGAAVVWIVANFDTVKAAFEVLQSNIAVIMNAAVSFLTSTWTTIVSLFGAARDGIKSAFSTVGGFFVGVWTAISNAFTETVTFFGTVFTDAYTAVTSAFSSVGEFFTNLWTSITNVFSTALADFTSIGTNMIQGIWNGISNGTQWLWDKLSGWCGSVINRVKSLFGIHSPSRVMRDQVGLMLGRGVAEGVTASAGIVQQAYDAMMPKEKTITAPMVASRGSAGGFSSGNDAGIAGMIAAALNGVTVQMDGQTVGRLIAPSVNEIIGRTARSARYA